jgi:hypothetical protein
LPKTIVKSSLRRRVQADAHYLIADAVAEGLGAPLKLTIRPVAQQSADVEAELDRLLFGLLVGAVERELSPERGAQRTVSPTGTNRDQAQADDSKLLSRDGAVDDKNNVSVGRKRAYNRRRTSTS